MEKIGGYVSLDGKRKLEIFRKPSGVYLFKESVVEFIVEPDPLFCEQEEIHWSCTHLSGLYDSSDAADTEAKAILPWLREGKYLPS